MIVGYLVDPAHLDPLTPIPWLPSTASDVQMNLYYPKTGWPRNELSKSRCFYSKRGHSYCQCRIIDVNWGYP